VPRLHTATPVVGVSAQTRQRLSSNLGVCRKTAGR
jgi:hypothetical protein